MSPHKSHTFQGPRISTRSRLKPFALFFARALDDLLLRLRQHRQAQPEIDVLRPCRVHVLQYPRCVFLGIKKVVTYPQRSNNYSCNWILLFEHWSNRMRKHIVSLEIGVAYVVTPKMLCHMFIGKLKISWISWKLLYNPFYLMEIFKY